MKNNLSLKNTNNEWEVKKLGEITSGKNSSLSIGELDERNGEYPVYGAGGIIQSIDSFASDKEYIGIIKDGAGVGRVLKCQPKTSLLGTLTYIFPKSNCDLDYLYYVLQNVPFNRFIIGSTIPHIYYRDYSTVRIPLPPLPEQKRISNILNTWDLAISKTHNLIEKIKLRNKGLAQHLLTGKKRLKGFDTRWRTFCISDLFRLENRHIKWNENSNYNLISIRRRYGGIFFRGSFHANEIQVKKLKEIKIGDFLISKRQVSHGAWAVVSSEFDSFLVSNEYDCLSINDNSVLSGAFWQWYIRQPKMTNYAFLDSIGVHIEKLIFHYKQFRKRQVKIPSLKEQQAITSVLEEADKELMLYHSQLNILKEQKKGLMQKLLTGQIRVNI